ncbi:hypothetical protein E0Z10_g4875 [Xylaria hypoxylon]|uniref:DEUBAD domain-containing protein n=1 Tax=Xylaria hypoxylon TaxID=37992 RepID=A0A4Z0YXB7_9PEZI|nr:hypothetical protein E0Z10_g4875 [Xylaria hypoxylon]
MPPRRTAFKNAPAKKTQADSRPSATSTPKRMMKLYRLRDKSVTPSKANRSPDELDSPVRACDTKQAEPNEEVILDQIVVSTTPQNTNLKRVGLNSESAVGSSSAVTSTLLRRSSRTSSISQSGGSTPSPLTRGIIMKKQDFRTSIAGNDDNEPDELSLPPTPKKPKVDPKPTQRVALRKSRSKWDNPDEMLTDTNSPLVKAKLRELLCSPRAWDILTCEEKEQILAKFPDNAEILDHGTPNARPDIAALLNNNNFRHDVARYQDGVSKGFHDPEWIQQAQSAHRSREMGVYDGFMADDFEERWEVPMPKHSRSESKVDGNGSRQVDDDSEEQANRASIEPKTIVESDDAANQCEGKNGTLRLKSLDRPHETSIEVSTQDRDDDMEDTDDSKAAPADNTPQAEDKKKDPSVENDAKQGGTAQVEAVTAQDPTKSDAQQLENDGHDVEISSVPSLPDAMEGIGHQSGEKGSETAEAEQVDTAGNTGSPDIKSA